MLVDLLRSGVPAVEYRACNLLWEAATGPEEVKDAVMESDPVENCAALLVSDNKVAAKAAVGVLYNLVKDRAGRARI